MDSSGLHVLLDAATDARSNGWKLEVRDDLSPQVRRLFELMGVGRLIFPTPAPAPATPAASRGRGLPRGAGHTLTGDTQALTMTQATGRSECCVPGYRHRPDVAVGSGRGATPLVWELST
jgi:hypothetical protein